MNMSYHATHHWVGVRFHQPLAPFCIPRGVQVCMGAMRTPPPPAGCACALLRSLLRGAAPLLLSFHLYSINE